MARIRSRDTKPEKAVRSLLHQMGYRFRVDYRPLPGRPDIAFTARRAAVFVHGCFWHQHSDVGCLDGRRPKSNGSYWNAKLDRTLERDLATHLELASLGWRVLIIWECEVPSKEALRERLSAFLGPPKRGL